MDRVDRGYNSSSSDLGLTDLDSDNEVYSDSEFDTDICSCKVIGRCRNVVEDETDGFGDCTIAGSQQGSRAISSTWNYAESPPRTTVPDSRCYPSPNVAVGQRLVPRMGTRLIAHLQCAVETQVTRSRLDSDTSAYQTGRESGSCSPVDGRLLPESNGVPSSAGTDNSVDNHRSSAGDDDVMQWVVRRRSDGSRYITRRPISCSKWRRRRHVDVRRDGDVIAEWRRRTLNAISALDSFTTLDELMAFGDNETTSGDRQSRRLLSVTAI